MKTRTSLQNWARALLVAVCGAWSLPVSQGAPAPELSLSLRGLDGDALEQGEALRVVVRLAAPRGAAAAIELAPASGSWVDALFIELLPAAGDVAVARALPLGQPETVSATLDRTRIAGGMWAFPAAGMQRVTTGEYRVQARLAIAAGRGWNGAVTAQPVTLRIVAPSADPVRVASRLLRRAQLAAAEGKLEEAARLADASLAQNPDHFELLCLRAEVALRAGNPLAARLCVGRAGRLLPAKPTGPPPLFFRELSERVAATKLPASAPMTKPPDWTWPPPAVMRLPEIEAVLAQRRAGPATPPRPAASSANVATNMTSASAPPAAAHVPAAPSSGAAVSGPPPGRIVPAAEADDAKIRADPAGQWAVSAIAGSSQKNAYGYYTPARATGAPKVVYAGYNTEAWCPGQQNAGEDWLELTFAKASKAAAVRVRQTFNPGAIVKVEAIAADGTTHVWWQGVDPYRAPATREFAWFAVTVPPTTYAVAKIKLTLDLAAVPGWKQIDAVQLVAAP